MCSQPPVLLQPQDFLTQRGHRVVDETGRFPRSRVTGGGGPHDVCEDTKEAAIKATLCCNPRQKAKGEPGFSVAWVWVQNIY